MPLLRRQPFEKQKPPPDLKPDDEVFHCKITNEIFTDYDQFFERMILCNSLVWTCALSGKPGLTYQEAVDSEEKARRQLSSLPEPLQKPLLYLANKTHRTRLADVNEDIFTYARERYFVDELVEVTFPDAKKFCKIVKVVPHVGSPKKTPSTPVPTPPENSDDDVICLDDPPAQIKTPTKEAAPGFGKDPTKFRYIVQEPKKNQTHTVKALQICRKKGVYTRDKSKLYLKMNCETGPDGFWKVKDRLIKKHKLNETDFSSYFAGPEPQFESSVAKKKKKKGEGEAGPSGEKGEKKKKGRPKAEKTTPKTVMPDEAQLAKMTPEERNTIKEKIKAEREAEKLAKKEAAKKQWEEEKQRRKEERDQERAKKLEEKKQREEYLREYNKPREDMECDDLKALPVPTDVQLAIPNDVFGDLVHVIEFLNCFSSLFDLHESFPEGITVESLVKGLVDTEVNGIYYDILRFLLMAIFNLQVEEEEEERELSEAETQLHQQKAFTDDILNDKDATSKDFMKAATAASMWSQLSYSCPLNKLQLEPFTITEIVRLHLVSSGAEASEENLRFRYQQRGGYTSLDDAGLEFRRQEPQLIKDLFKLPVFDLSPEDKLKVLGALVNQLLTFMACRDFIEDNYEKVRGIKNELRQLQTAEQKRERDEAAFWYKRKLEDKAKERVAEEERKEKKKKAKEDRLRLDEYRKKAKAEKKDLLELLKAEGLTELIARMEEDAQEAEQQKSQETNHETEKGKQDELPGRRSARQTQRKIEEKRKMLELHEIPTENIEWDKVSADEKQQWKEVYQAKQEELHEELEELQHSYSIAPIGRDRTFRRYWVFRSVPGLFVENFEEFIPEDYLQPAEQIHKTFNSEHLPLEGTNLNQSSEGKSTSSDKENEDINSAANKNNSDLKNTSEAMEVDNKAEVQNVYDQISQFNMTRWAFYHKPEQLDVLIASLNPRGNREGPLRAALLEQKQRMLQKMKQCPIDLLHTDSSKNSKKTEKFHKVKSRNRQGVIKGSSAEELLELNLREMLLELEDRIYAGSLGAIKVADRPSWREAIEEGSYSAQCDTLSWSDKTLTLESQDEKMEVDEAESKGTERSGQVVKDLARALLQIEQGIDHKYLSPPIGEDEDTKKAKQQAALEAAFKKLTPKKSKKAGHDSYSEDESEEDSPPEFKSSKDRWEEALMVATNLSQVFLHLTVLEKSVSWDKSSLNARCRICRRKGDAEKMLLCDGCDRGHHMYCLKPQVKKIPEGDWYCPDCKPKDIMRTPRKARRQSSMRDVTESSEDEEEEEETPEDSEDADSEEEDDSEDEADSDDDDDDNDDDEEDEEEEESDADEQEEDEESPVPTKIKLGVRGKKRSSSGRSTPNIPSGRSSRNATPRENTPEEGRNRARQRLNMETSRGKSADKSRKSMDNKRQSLEPRKSRASLEPDNRSRSTSRAASRNASRNPSREPSQTRGNKHTPKNSTGKGSKVDKVTPKGGSRTTPKGGSRTTPKGGSRTTPKGGSRTTPKGGSRTTPKDKAAKAVSPASGGRGTKRKAVNGDTEDEPPAKVGKVRGGEDGAHLKQCEDLVTVLMKEADAWPFLRPVTKRDAPDYLEIIRHPMDFSKIKVKINKFEYQEPTEILEDIRLIFTNCERYNEVNTDEYAAGQRLCRLFVRKVKELKLDSLLAAKAMQNGSSPQKQKSQGKTTGASTSTSSRRSMTTKAAAEPMQARRSSRKST